MDAALEPLWKNLLSALIFSVFGLLVLGIAFLLFDRLTPGHLWQEIAQKNNTALAVTASAFILAMAIIIAAAIQG